MDPANVAPLVAWLASEESGDVTGQVFEVEGGRVSVAERWHHGPARRRGSRWEPDELGPVIRELLGELRPPDPVYGTP
jgi:NAD(P)-dependent dehydrogenase (short-subunit alcohol dehydrogenase family)